MPTRSGRSYQFPPSPRFGGRGAPRQTFNALMPRAVWNYLAASAAGAAGYYGNRYFSGRSAPSSSTSTRRQTIQPTSFTTTRTIPKKRITKKAMGYSGPSKSSGKFKRGLKARKAAKRKIVKRSNNGVNYTIETTKTLSNLDLVICGHATYPRLFMLENAVKALFYKILYDLGCPPASTSEVTSFTPGDLIEFYYRLTPSAGVLSTAYAIPVGGASISDIMVWFLDATRAWYNAYECDFTEIRMSGSSNSPFRINAHEILIKSAIRTHLKIQNRILGAIAGETGDENAVDNVPVYGKTYSGTGTGLRRKYNNLPNQQDYWCDQQYATIAPTTYDDKEPPQINQFSNAKFAGKAKLDPGDLKTSTLSSNFSMYFNTIFRYACDWQIGGSIALNRPRDRTLGKYRVFFLEKMLGIGAALITVAFENNLEGSFQAQIRKKSTTIKDYYKVSL